MGGGGGAHGMFERQPAASQRRVRLRGDLRSEHRWSERYRHGRRRERGRDRQWRRRSAVAGNRHQSRQPPRDQHAAGVAERPDHHCSAGNGRRHRRRPRWQPWPEPRGPNGNRRRRRIRKRHRGRVRWDAWRRDGWDFWRRERGGIGKRDRRGVGKRDRRGALRYTGLGRRVEHRDGRRRRTLLRPRCRHDRHERRYSGDLADGGLRRWTVRPSGRLREPRLSIRGLRGLWWRGPGLLSSLRHQRSVARHLRGRPGLRPQSELSTGPATRSGSGRLPDARVASACRWRLEPRTPLDHELIALGPSKRRYFEGWRTGPVGRASSALSNEIGWRRSPPAGRR
jgi:hypothetical protein